jgi:hypothetical protein
MSKVSGIVSSLSVDDSTGTPQTISDDTTQVTISIPRGQQDVTGLDKVAVERLGLLYDCTITVTGVADFGANKEHAVFKADPTGTRTVAVGLANAAATLTAECNLSDYTFTRAQDGSLTYTATLVNANGAQPVWT